MSNEFSTCVSVIIPAHNAEATILDAVRSTLKQELTQVEIIVCDDASTDKTRALIIDLSEPNLRLISNDSNLGPGQSRDRAISASTGKWIALLDADDAWVPHRLQRLREAAEFTDADVVFDDLMLCHDTKNGLAPWRAIHGKHAFGESGSNARNVQAEHYIRAGRLLVKPMVRASFIRKHAIQHSARRFAEDTEFMLRLVYAGARFCYVPSPMYLYRITPGSLTAQARDPTLMRYCLEECSRWEGWSREASAAFDQKIAALRRTEALYAITDALGSGKLMVALRELAASPGAVFELPARLARQFDYQWHRRRHGGRKR